MTNYEFSNYIACFDRWKKMPPASRIPDLIFWKSNARMSGGKNWASTWGDIFLAAKQTLDEQTDYVK